MTTSKTSWRTPEQKNISITFHLQFRHESSHPLKEYIQTRTNKEICFLKTIFIPSRLFSKLSFTFFENSCTEELADLQQTTNFTQTTVVLMTTTCTLHISPKHHWNFRLPIWIFLKNRLEKQTPKNTCIPFLCKRPFFLL